METSLVSLIGVLGSAILGALSALGVQFLKNLSDKHKQSVEDAVHENTQELMFAEIQRKMANVEKKLDEHNHYAQRFAEIEKSIVRIDERQAAIMKSIK